MKSRANAKQKREAEARRRKGLWSPAEPAPVPEPAGSPASAPPVRKPPEREPRKSPEEEAREFLEYLDRYDAPVFKDDPPGPVKKKTGASAVTVLNLEEGMPVVSEALDRLRLGLQEMRFRRVKVVKLIHGYGSTGRGGKIRAGVREELAGMKRKKLIRDYIPGEDFGPVDAASRKLAEQCGNIVRDPDYGRMNHGITVVHLL